MKKQIIAISILSLLFTGIVFAQEDGSVDPGLSPDSPFYFLDTIGEKISLFFTFKAERKAEKALRFAEEKFAEAKAMAERNSAKALEKADERYQHFLELANRRAEEVREKGKDVEELAAKITENALRHREVLKKVLEKVPEEARSGIERAIEVSERGFDSAIQSVSGERKEEFRSRFSSFDERDENTNEDEAVEDETTEAEDEVGNEGRNEEGEEVGEAERNREEERNKDVSSAVQCEFKEMTFYYLDSCGYCQKVKSDGSLEKLEELGVNITRVDAREGPINHEFQGVPTFVVNDRVYSGYRNLEGMEDLLHCE